MKNKYNLSKIDYEWLSRDTYDHDDSISATTLLKPIREIIAIKNCSDQLTIDIADKIWAVVGTACHAMREQIDYPGLQKEKRFYSKINGVKISGKFDTLDALKHFPCLPNNNGRGFELVINDLKTTTVWNIKKGNFIDWTQQLSIYKLILYHNKINTYDWGVISALIRDWTYSDEQKIAGCQLQNIPLELMPMEETHQLIEWKIDNIKPYLECADINTMPLCSENDRQKYNGKICLKYCQARMICDYGIELSINNLK